MLLQKFLLPKHIIAKVIKVDIKAKKIPKLPADKDLSSSLDKDR
jgi:hypothetical protein